MSANETVIDQPISVFLVEDHALLREGVRQIISLHPDLEVIGEVSNGEEAVKAIPQLRPDVVLLDVNLPGINGIQVIQRVRAQYKSTAFIVLTAHDDKEQTIYALRAGAVGFCPKEIEAERLISIIRQVAAGAYAYIIRNQFYDEKGIHDWIKIHVGALTAPYGGDPSEHFTPLSKREMQILEFVTHGSSNQEIAYALGISHQTVKNHMTSILRKLDVQDRTQAAVYAIQQGWVRVND